MKCVEFSVAGEPGDVLNCVDRPQPSPSHGEVLVRMLASPINPSDMMFVRGIYGVAPKLPQIPGFEGVGIVEASGGGLKGKFFSGKRVAVLSRAGGNWAEKNVVPSGQVIPLSRKLSVEQAATFFVNPATAWIMTQEVLRIPQGAWLLQTAATSSLGKMIIRLGQLKGFRTLNVVRRNSDHARLKTEGATAVITFDPEQDSPESLQNAVAGIVGSDGLRYAIDPVGGITASAVAQSLTLDGRLLLYGTLSGQPLQFSPRTLMQHQATIEGFWLGNFMNNMGLIGKLRLVKRITGLIIDGTLSSDIEETYGPEEITAAVVAAEKTGRIGKTLLKFSDK